jgi:glycosyltransferase involved in cell wall biosynthesis
VKVFGLHKRADYKNEVMKSDVILSQFATSFYAKRLAIATGKPHVNIMHTPRQIEIYRLENERNFIFNAEWCKQATGRDGVVCRPLVRVDDYTVKSNRRYVTLVNLNENKGGQIFGKIAEAMPDVEFMGVIGSYDKQYRTRLPNLRIEENTKDMKRIYSQTGILLVPSLIETWGRVATEAMVSGIPVIATRTDGLLECVGTGGQFVADRENVSEWVQLIRSTFADYDLYLQKAKLRSNELQLSTDVDTMEDYLMKLAKEAETRFTTRTISTEPAPKQFGNEIKVKFLRNTPRFSVGTVALVDKKRAAEWEVKGYCEIVKEVKAVEPSVKESPKPSTDKSDPRVTKVKTK